MNDEILQTLEDGQAFLMSHEWVKGNHLAAAGQMSGTAGCVLTALSPWKSVSVEWDLVNGARDYLSLAAWNLFPQRTGGYRGQVGGLSRYVANVNDHPDTTFNDVMEIYEEAKRLRKAEL